MKKRARLIVPVRSKMPGVEMYVERRIGTICIAERVEHNPGTWILWFGKTYFKLDAIKLHDTVEFTSENPSKPQPTAFPREPYREEDEE